MNENPPEILYRYKPWGEFAKEIVGHSKLYFCCPNDLNDPFDCRARILPPRNKQLVKRRIIDNLVAQGVRRQAVIDQYKKDNKAGIIEKLSSEEELRRRQKVIMQEYGVCSASEKRDDILMWSHYADNHAGVCIGFRTSGIFKNAWKVVYSNTMPQIAFGDVASDEEKKLLVTTKAEQWSYEVEWRLTLRVRNGVRHVSFGSDEIAEVIVGCQASSKTIEEVRQACESTCTKARVYIASKHPSKYELQLNELGGMELTSR